MKKYSAIDRLLHAVVLGSKTVRKASFDFDRLMFNVLNKNSKKLIFNDSPIYVCGLARSGTTILLNLLDQVDGLASLNYRDMPFILAPNLWKRINIIGFRKESPTERAHADGIAVGYDSPEAFEEIFWKTYCDSISSGTKCYGLSAPTEDTLSKFSNFRFQVALSKYDENSGKVLPRYLSKNNNNLTRLSTLSEEKNAQILLVYRDPLETAQSLLRLHQSFLLGQQEDSFMLQYMNWLGHHEFGLDFKPFCFAASSQNPSLMPDTIDYWLDYWCAIYRYIITHQSKKIYLINHDSMRANPAMFLKKLFRVLRLEADENTLSRDIKPNTTSANEASKVQNPEILDSAYVIYKVLLDDSRNIHLAKN